MVTDSVVAESAWVSVDRHTLETRFPGVYAIGDVVAVPLTLGKPLPKAGVFAHAEAEIVAKNIARTIAGQGTPQRFNGYGECFIEFGDGKAGWGGGNFYAEPHTRADPSDAKLALAHRQGPVRKVLAVHEAVTVDQA